MKSCIGNTYKCGQGPDGDLSINPRSMATRKARGKTKTTKELASQMNLFDDSVQKDPDDSFALVDFGDVEGRATKPGGVADAEADAEKVLPREPAHMETIAKAAASDSLTPAQQRKGTFQPMVASPPQKRAQKVAQDLSKIVSVVELPANSMMSNQNTDESSAYPKQAHGRTDSYQNLPMFAESASNPKASGEDDLDAPRSNFFDPAQFGQKPKRSSTEPKEADRDEDLDADHQDSRNQTQTITDSNASRTHASISFPDQDPRDNILARQRHEQPQLSEKHETEGQEGPTDGSSDQKAKPSKSSGRGTGNFAHMRTQLASSAMSILGHDVEEDEDEIRRVAGTIASAESQGMAGEAEHDGPGGTEQLPGSLQHGAPTVFDNYVAGQTSKQPQSFVEKQNKRKWKMPSFLSHSSHSKGKVMNHLQQPKKRLPGQASARAGGEPTVEEYPLELFTSVMEDPVQPSNNPSVLRTTDVEDDDDDPRERPSGIVQKAVSETGNSSDSFVSIDSQDLTQQIARYSSKKNKSHNDYQDALARKGQAFGEPNNNDINEGVAEEPHFGAQKTAEAEGPTDDDLVFDRSISIGGVSRDQSRDISRDGFAVVNQIQPEEMSVALNFEDLPRLLNERAEGGANRSHFTKSAGLLRPQESEKKDTLQSDPHDLSVSFTARSRKLISMHSNISKKSVWKSLWHRAPVLNINTYKIQFGMQGEKVRYDHHDSYPICLLGVKFKPENKPFGGQNYAKHIKKHYKKLIKTNFYESLIWCSYRNKLENSILSDPCSQRYLQQVLPDEEPHHYNTDMNWGCTIRVGQMLVCNALMRHLLIDREFRYAKAEAFEQFGLHTKFSLQYLQDHPDKWEIYLNVLAQVIDNKLPEDTINSQPVQPMQAFQIQNVSKMALATRSTMPGTWFGVGAVSHLFCKLNRLFRPMCDNFQICVLGDGFVLFERIASKMRKEVSIPYRTKTYEHLDEDDQMDKTEEKEAIEAIFHEEIKEQQKWKRHFRVLQYPSTHLRHQQENYNFTERIESNQENLVGNYRNGCLVIVTCMMGVQKIEKEYFEPIRYIFHEPNIVMGAMGGRPGQALYFVGLQNYELLFFDPHLVQEAVTYHEDEWVDCEINKDEFAEFQQNSISKNKSTKKKKKGIPLLKTRKSKTNKKDFKAEGPRFPKIKIRDDDRQTYHCKQTRKLHLSKCDPTMAFAFYLRNEGDFRQFYWLQKRGKERFGSNWPFSLMDMYVMDKYFQQYKNKQTSLTNNWKPMNQKMFMDEKMDQLQHQHSLVKQRKERMESMTSDYMPNAMKQDQISPSYQSNHIQIMETEHSQRSFVKDDNNLLSFGPGALKPKEMKNSLFKAQSNSTVGMQRESSTASIFKSFGMPFRKETDASECEIKRVKQTNDFGGGLPQQNEIMQSFGNLGLTEQELRNPFGNRKDLEKR